MKEDPALAKAAAADRKWLARHPKATVAFRLPYPDEAKHLQQFDPYEREPCLMVIGRGAGEYGRAAICHYTPLPQACGADPRVYLRLETLDRLTEAMAAGLAYNQQRGLAHDPVHWDIDEVAVALTVLGTICTGRLEGSRPAQILEHIEHALRQGVTPVVALYFSLDRAAGEDVEIATPAPGPEHRATLH